MSTLDVSLRSTVTQYGVVGGGPEGTSEQSKTRSIGGAGLAAAVIVGGPVEKLADSIGPDGVQEDELRKLAKSVCKNSGVTPSNENVERLVCDLQGSLDRLGLFADGDTIKRDVRRGRNSGEVSENDAMIARFAEEQKRKQLIQVVEDAEFAEAVLAGALQYVDCTGDEAKARAENALKRMRKAVKDCCDAANSSCSDCPLSHIERRIKPGRACSLFGEYITVVNRLKQNEFSKAVNFSSVGMAKEKVSQLEKDLENAKKALESVLATGESLENAHQALIGEKAAAEALVG